MHLLFLQQWLPDEILKALSWTFVHSLWQGLGAAILAAIIILFTRKSTAKLRYNLLGMVVILFLVATGITFSQQLKNGTVAEKLVTPFTANEAGTAVVTFDTPAETVVTTNVTKELVGFLNANADLFVLIWGIFFLVNCMKLITGMAGVHRMRQYKTHSVSKDWQTKLNQLGKALGIQQSVRLLQSELVKVPVAIGHFKPVILVPLGLLSHLPPDQVETILLHELAHVRRKDYLINILQRFAESVFFFNPALLWISSLIRQEREACCDDIVVANTNHKGNYLEALISFHEYVQPSTGYAMAISTKRHYLLNRVRRMVTRENKKLNLMEKIFLLIGVITVTAFTFIPQKESEVKRDQAAVEPVKTLIQPVAPVSAVNNSVSKLSLVRPNVKKITKDPVLEITVDNPRIDTVPDSKNKVRGFSNMSTSVNDENGVRTEITTIIDNDGKKYSFTKLNDKITSFIVDGRPVPESEMGNYSDFFARIELIREEKRKAKEEKMKWKKEEDRIRKEELKIRQDEKRLRLEDEKSRDQEKKIRDKEKENEKEMKNIEKKMKDKEKAMNDIEKKQEKLKNEFEDKQKDTRKKFDDDMKKLRDERNKENEILKKKMEKNRDELRKEKDRISEERQKTLRKDAIDKRGGRINQPRSINGREVIKNDEREINNSKEINENDTRDSNAGLSANGGKTPKGPKPLFELNKANIFANTDIFVNTLKAKQAVEPKLTLFNDGKFKYTNDNFKVRGNDNFKVKDNDNFKVKDQDKKGWEPKHSMPDPPKSQPKPPVPPVKKQRREVVFKAPLRTESIA